MIQLPIIKNESVENTTFRYFRSILKMCDLGKTVLDLGTGHGRYAIMCRDAGFNVTAVDGRKDRVPFGEKNIDWKICDVSKMDVSGFDTVLLLGLLYHLPYKRQIELIQKIDSRIMIVNTHTTILKNGKICNTAFRNKLEGIERHGKIVGATYRESRTIGQLSGRPLASLNNTTSFWPTEESLLEMIIDYAGFDMVDILAPYITEGRTFMVARRK